MQMNNTDKRIIYTGRWGADGESMTATAPGACFELAFRGNTVLLAFDTASTEYPRPDLYLSLDGRPRFEAPVSPFLRVSAAEDGEHRLTVLLKSAAEKQRRWCQPLVGRVSFLFAEAEGFGTLPPDLRPTIEFIGDSITEGILINPECVSESAHSNNGPWQDDVTATYAFLTAEALGLRPYFFAYGAVGVTRGGNGGVPAAPASYPFNFDGSPVTCPHPDYVLINHGANDRGAEPSRVAACYRELLALVTETHPAARVFVLPPFCGAQFGTIRDTVSAFTAETGRDIRFLDSTGWIPPEPLHPDRSGHIAIASRLIPLLRDQL